LHGLIESKLGIGKVHVQELDGHETGRICIPIDTNLVSMGKSDSLQLKRTRSFPVDRLCHTEKLAKQKVL
jgi:hypothetical protein